jgi:nucleoside-diphosphate-sugar epimerase
MSETKNKLVIVTGAGGYIGTSLVPFLLSKGYKVRAIDRFFFGENLLKNQQNLEIIKDDIRNLDNTHFKNGFAIIDLAAISNDPSGERYAKQTFEINHLARFNNAKLAKSNGLKRYIIPSSCSNYGKINDDEIADETFKTNPLANYSAANVKAENDILPLADDNFCAIVLRQGTVYGISPKMRFDLAINGMTYGAWKNGVLPLMRPGTQRRPFLHIKDVLRVMYFMLNIDPKMVSGQIFNAGGHKNNYSIKDLSEIFKNKFNDKLKIEWYGSDDDRSYFVNFDKIKSIGFVNKFNAEDGIDDLLTKLESGEIDKTDETITLKWYQTLEHWQEKIKSLEIDGKLLKL